MQPQSTLYALLAAAGLAASGPALAHGGFDGHEVTVEYGVDLGLGTGWQSLDSRAVAGGAGLEIGNWVVATTQAGTSVAWDVDFEGHDVLFRYVGTADFMNFGSPPLMGFRVVDASGMLWPITGALVTNTGYVADTPGNLIEGYDPAGDLTFDADHFYVNLNQSMYHHHAMPGMGDPYRDLIAVRVELASPAPEPQDWALLLAGLGLVGWRARRRAGGASWS